MIIRLTRPGKSATLKTRDRLAAWLFLISTLLMLSSVFHMWSHWLEIAADLGSGRAACILSAVTGAALVLAWWVNTDPD